MEFISGLVGGVNFEVILQLLALGSIIIAGPVVVFILAFRGGDL